MHMPNRLWSCAAALIAVAVLASACGALDEANRFDQQAMEGVCDGVGAPFAAEVLNPGLNRVVVVDRGTAPTASFERNPASGLRRTVSPDALDWSIVVCTRFISDEFQRDCEYDDDFTTKMHSTVWQVEARNGRTGEIIKEEQMTSPRACPFFLFRSESLEAGDTLYAQLREKDLAHVLRSFGVSE